MVDGVSQGVYTSYTFSNVTSNHTILVNFVLRSDTSTATCTTGSYTVSEINNKVIYTFTGTGSESLLQPLTLLLTFSWSVAAAVVAERTLLGLVVITTMAAVVAPAAS